LSNYETLPTCDVITLDFSTMATINLIVEMLLDLKLLRST